MLSAEKAQNLLTKRIAACRDKGALPVELIDLVGQVYSLQLAARDQAQVKLPDDLPDPLQRTQGISLVERNSFPVDRVQALELFSKLKDVVSAISAPLATACAIISTAIADKTLDLDAAMQAYLRHDEAFFTTWAERTPVTPRMLPMLIQAALTPSIERAAELLSTMLDPEATWPHGHCPVCGSLPIMSELRDKEGFRFHICGFCHAEYRASRLQCPFCLETDAAKLEFYEAKEEPGFRINACRNCNMYIKVTDFRNMDRKSLPLFDDLDSLSLDVLARAKKLKRPNLSAWGF